MNFEGFGSGGVLSNNSALNGGMVSSFVSFGITKDLWLGGLVSGPGGLGMARGQQRIEKPEKAKKPQKSPKIGDLMGFSNPKLRVWQY